MVQLSRPYMTIGKIIALSRWIFVSKVMFLLFNMLSRLVIAYLPRSKHLLISWLQSPSAMISEPKKIKSVTVSIASPSIYHEVMGLADMILVFCMLSLGSVLYMVGDLAAPLGSAQGFHDGSDGKESSCNAGDTGSIPGSRRSPGKRNDNTLQYSCLGNPLDRGAWQVHGVTKSQTWLLTNTFTFHLGSTH